MKGGLNGLLAFIALIITAGSFYQYIQTKATMYFVVAIIALLATIALGGMFLSGRVNKSEDIHITE